MRPSRAIMARLMAAALTITLLVSCGSGGDGGDGVPRQGGTLRIADEGEAVTLNPFKAQDNFSQRAFAQIVEPLFRTDPDGEVIPWLVAESTPSEDYLTWTFELRPDVMFTNGEPMTPEDVVFSLDSIRQSAGWQSLFSEISSVEVGSPTSVVVTTSVPSPGLEASLSLPFAAIVPVDLGGMTPKEFGEDPIGTGPFKVKSWERGSTLTLERNDDYWDPELPLLDELVYVTATSDSSRVLQLRGGDLDMVAAPPLPQVDSLDRSPTKVGVYEMAQPQNILLNHRSDIFSDPRVREAVDLAVDREAIVSAATSDVGEVGGSWFTPALKYFDDSLTTERDVDRAAQLLAEAVADGVDPRFALTIAAGGSAASLTAQIIKENLDDVGFTVTIEQVDPSAIVAEVAAGNYEASLFGLTSDIVDPSEIVGFYLDLDALWTGADTTELSALFDTVKREPDEAAREDLYQQIQEVVLEERGLVPLSYRPWVWAMNEDVVGFDLAPTGVPWFADVGFRG
jgi:peptide/nickel transport system substrate-binding protein